jgi:hypothetical protein
LYLIQEVLVPELKQGQTVVMDNTSFHKGKSVERIIIAAKCKLLYLPPYSPDFNPYFYPQFCKPIMDSVIILSFRFSYPRHKAICPGSLSCFLFINPPNFPNQITASFIVGGLSGSLFIWRSRMYRVFHSSEVRMLVQGCSGLDTATFDKYKSLNAIML